MPVQSDKILKVQATLKKRKLKHEMWNTQKNREKKYDIYKAVENLKNWRHKFIQKGSNLHKKG